MDPRLVVHEHGKAPYRVVVVHGGPGAGGEMAPVATGLAGVCGVLEPIQTESTVAGQVAELARAVRTLGQPPVTLVGFSWGAWLSLLTAARHPALVRKLVLVGCGPLETKHVPAIEEKRLHRLPEAERGEYRRVLDRLARARTAPELDALLERLAALTRHTDAYDPVAERPETSRAVPLAPGQGRLFRAVWREAAQLRASGELLARAARVTCPVVALHGAEDPHPAAGVREPLAARLPGFRFVLLPRCGHKPWIERHARAAFFAHLTREVGSTADPRDEG